MGKVDHPFGIVPAGPDPAPHKIVKIFCDSRICQLHGMAGIYKTCFLILAAQDQHAGLWIEQEAPVADLLHVNGLRPGIDPHDLRHNRYFFYKHPSKLS